MKDPLSGLDAAVLAGGRSRRFGSDKTRLSADGEGILARTVRILREAGFPRVRIVGGEDRAVPGAEFLPDDAPGLGPAGGIATVLRPADEGVFVVGGDMPALSVPLIKAVIAAWDGRASVAAPRRDGRWEPLCALYSRCALPEAERAAREGRSLQDVLNELGAQEVVLTEDFYAGLINVNTPEEWETYLKCSGKSA